MGYGGWGMGGFGGLGMILFWILAILAIVWLLRTLGIGGGFPRRDEDARGDANRPDALADNRADTRADDRALAILRERYARGEIDTEEFEQRKRDLLRKDQP